MSTHHIAALLLPAWGHTVGYIYLATRVLQKDPNLVITIVQHSLAVAQMEAELKTCDYEVKRLRIIAINDKETPSRSGIDSTIAETLNQLIESWMEIILELCQGHEGWPKPHAIHMDMAIGGYVIEPTKQIMGPDCKILMWCCTAVASMASALNEYDFAAIAQEIYSDPTRRRDRSMDDILEQVARAWNGTDELSGVVVKCPGVPYMYDHERVGYAAGPQALAVHYVYAQKLAKVVDGYIVATDICLEPIGVPYCREFYRERGQELFTVGLQGHGSDAAPMPPTNAIVKSFLENSIKQHGAKSVVYISFGSFYFPTATPELVEALVNTLLTLEMPFLFIFALGGASASLPTDLVHRVNSSGRGIACDFWVEQRAIFQHDAVGWFITHGGFNSISESLSQGIPLIVWPICADQPINAALISSGPNPVAIELMQVRTGHQLRPSLRGGPPITGAVEDASAEFKVTFEAARGPRGVILKENAAKIARDLRDLEAQVDEVSDVLVRLARL
ncbi:hypothetical protein DFH09DRAFT_1360306 [Mycena vulgaris]|nr:hypothetical protein DFH09DRAFT_1360306 [Mycena vulgaris]